MIDKFQKKGDFVSESYTTVKDLQCWRRNNVEGDRKVGVKRTKEER